MAQPASSNQKSTSNGPQASFTPGQPPSSTAHPAPRLSQAPLGQDSATLTLAQRTLLDSLRSRAHALRWSADGKNAATRDDVLDFFTELKAGAAQLHAMHDAHPTTPELASCIKALEQLLKRFGDALKPNAGSGIAVADFDLSACRTVFGALSVLSDPAWPSLFNRAQRRALQPLMQDLSAALLLVQDPSALLLPAKARFAKATGVSEQLPLLNWICRGVKKDLLKPDDHIAALFESAIGGIAAWLDDVDVPKESRHIGECAAILNTVIDRDLLNLKRGDQAAQQRSRELTQCALLLCSEHSFAVLAKPPVNGVAVINLCNLVKDLIEKEAVSIDRAQPQLQRLLDLVVDIPNQAMSGGDGRVLSNVGNFLRMLMTRAPADGAQRKAQAEMLMPACRRVLAALNAEAFGNGVKNAQSLSNLASFLQEFHRYALSGAGDEGLRRNFAAALGKLIARVLAKRLSAFDDRRNISGLLDALAYLQGQGLCGDAAALQALCSDLRARESGLPREKVAAPAPLESLDAELPKLSAEPTLKTGETGPGNAPGEAKRPIPGEGAIIRPLRSFEAAQIVPGTTYLRPTAGRGKFARAGKVEVDGFSQAARDAFDDTNESGSGESDEQEEKDAQVHAGGLHASTNAREAKGEKSPGNRNGVVSRRKERTKRSTDAGSNLDAHCAAITADTYPPTAPLGPDAEALVALIRGDNARSAEDLIRELQGFSKDALPHLPGAFLDEACRGKLLNDSKRRTVFDAYLRLIGKAHKERLRDHFEKRPPIFSKVQEMLISYGIIGRMECASLYEKCVKTLPRITSATLEGRTFPYSLKPVLEQMDEFHVRKLARELVPYRSHILSDLVCLKKAASMEWFLDEIGDEAQCNMLMALVLRAAILTDSEWVALRLIKHGGVGVLRESVKTVDLSAWSIKGSICSIPMYAAMYGRRPILKAMFEQAPEAFATRLVFGWNVLSMALLKDNRDLMVDLLGWMRPDVADMLASPPALSPEEEKIVNSGEYCMDVPLDPLGGYKIKNMPGFDAISCACATDAVRCLPVLLSHDNSRFARKLSPEQWKKNFEWPDLHSSIRDMLENFIADQLCRCIPHIGPTSEFTHWMSCAQHLFINASSTRGIARPMRLAVEHKRGDLAGLLLSSATRAQLDALKKEANASDWTGVFPGIDAPMLAVLKAAEERADADERLALAHSSAAASSRAPQSLQ